MPEPARCAMTSQFRRLSVASRPSRSTGPYFADFKVGMGWRTRERVVTANDISDFAPVSWELDALYFDEGYSQNQRTFGAPITHGGFGTAVVADLFQCLGITAKTLYAFGGFTWTMRRSIRIADAIHSLARVERTFPSTTDDRGYIVFAICLINQLDEIIQKGSARASFEREPQ